MRLFSFESSINDKYPYKTGNEVCGVVVDKASGKGKVTLSGSGYRTVVVLTDYDPSKKDRYEYLDISTALVAPTTKAGASSCRSSRKTASSNK